MCPYHVTRTPTNGSAVSLSRDTDGDTSDRTLMDLDQLLKCLYPLSSFLYSPFKNNKPPRT